jgi:acyl-coenzyme A thioesterase PaaI-like protein
MSPDNRNLFVNVKITGKQPNSKMCFVCGIENDFGLKSRFYELENNEIMAVFTPSDEHQGYPGRLHGGIAAAILDETIGRAVMKHKTLDYWGVTVDFAIKFRQPVSLDQEIRVIARVTREKKRTFEGTGEILLADNSVAVEGRGRYLKMDLSRITEYDFRGEEWQVRDELDDPVEVTL